jgi:hypothetical protein
MAETRSRSQNSDEGVRNRIGMSETGLGHQQTDLMLETGFEMSETRTWRSKMTVEHHVG